MDVVQYQNMMEVLEETGNYFMKASGAMARMYDLLETIVQPNSNNPQECEVKVFVTNASSQP